MTKILQQPDQPRMQRASENTDTWIETLHHLYEAATKRYQEGLRGQAQVIPQTSRKFLESIGTSAQEIYDYVEDWMEDGEPSFSTVAAITGVRRDYFVHIQQSIPSKKVTDPTSLPSGREELGGYRWLPRIIAKAQAKIRGEMSPDLMYGCGADRPFLRKIGIDPAEFLRIVWHANNDQQAVLEAVKKHA